MNKARRGLGRRFPNRSKAGEMSQAITPYHFFDYINGWMHISIGWKPADENPYSEWCPSSMWRNNIADLRNIHLLQLIMGPARYHLKSQKTEMYSNTKHTIGRAELLGYQSSHSEDKSFPQIVLDFTTLCLFYPKPICAWGAFPYDIKS